MIELDASNDAERYFSCKLILHQIGLEESAFQVQGFNRVVTEGV